MKISTLVIFIEALLLIANQRLVTVSAQSPAGNHLQLIASDNDKIVLEFTVPDYQIETTRQNDRSYHRLLIPDTVQSEAPGEPQLPTIGALLGVPTIQGAAVEILESDVEILDNIQPAPAPILTVIGNTPLENSVKEIFDRDEAIYSTDAFYPDPIVTIGQTALMRGPPVVQVQFYPAQYNPVSGQVRLYRRILARITWTDEAEIEATAAVGSSPAYEQLLQSTILNYGTLARPPALPASPSAGVRLAETGSLSSSLKIGVDEDGVYQLTYSDIVSAGFALADVVPRTLKLTHRGAEIPILVEGEADGVFDPADTMLFYGTAITNRYTTRNIYWLAAGDSNGQRITVRDGTPHGASVPPHFPVTQRFEEDSYYWQAMPPHMQADPWFWWIRYNAPMTRSYSISLANISTAARSATLRLRLHGQTSIAAVNPDHHTRLSLNDIDVDPAGQWWDGQTVFDHAVTVSHTAVLTEGNNEITLAGVGDTGAVVDQFLLNWIELDYWATYVAEHDSLVFGGPAAGTFQFEITGFTGSDITTFDVTFPTAVVMMTGTNIISESDGFKLQVEDKVQPESRYLALTPARYKTPASIELDQPSAWQADQNGADYIIITHENFYTGALRLANHRAAGGLRVATVKVGDIYDEFNAGIFSPQAIRDFLSYAYHQWQPRAPTYVVLVGDAVFDHKDNYASGKINYVPAPVIHTGEMGETPSDNWYVTIDGADIMPDMLIGRLSVETETQADELIDKIIQYEQEPPHPSWQNRVLLVADDNVAAFELTSEALAQLLPATFTTTKVYAADYPPGNPTLDITTQINGGSLLVNYVGHGNSTSWGSWSGGRIYDADNILALDNTGKPPLVTIANCLNGFFTSPFSLIPVAEAFLRLKNKGAVAVWRPTGLGYPSGHRALMTEFYGIVFQEKQYSLGGATTAAKIAMSGQYAAWGELVETYVLFGEPAMRLAVPSRGSLIYLPLVTKDAN